LRAFGSALASPLYEHGGWTLVAGVALAFPLVAFVHYRFVGCPHAPGRT